MHTGPGAHFSAKAQGLGHRYRSRILARVLKKRCVHISAQRESYSGTSTQAPSVNTPLISLIVICVVYCRLLLAPGF